MATITTLLTKAPEEGEQLVGTGAQVAKVRVSVSNSGISGFDVVQLFDLEANVFIHDVVINVVGAFGASVTGTVGDGSDADRFIDSTLGDLNTTGWIAAHEDAQPGSEGYEYSSADTVDLTIGGATPSSGTLDVYLIFSRVGSVG